MIDINRVLNKLKNSNKRQDAVAVANSFGQAKKSTAKTGYELEERRKLIISGIFTVSSLIESFIGSADGDGSCIVMHCKPPIYLFNSIRQGNRRKNCIKKCDCFGKR